MHFAIEVLSLSSLLDTRIREIPTMLLRVGHLKFDSDVGFQIGPVSMWYEPGGAGCL